MCDPSAYMLKDGQEELVLEGIDRLRCEGDDIDMTSISGEKKSIKARIKGLSLVEHKILLEPL